MICSAPFVLTAQKTGSRKIVGEGDYQFEVIHDWLKLPDQFTWQTTHNVAVDQNGGFFDVSSGPEWLLMIWQKQEERVRGGERLRRAVLAERH